jgi:hypothetical protein
MKHRKTKNRRRPTKTGKSSMDPKFRHVLATDISAQVNSGTDNQVVEMPFNTFSGFSQLSSFFYFARPIRYRIVHSYTNWVGSTAFIPVNYQSETSVPTGFLPNALMTVRGSVRVQPGYNNIGSWSAWPFANLGWNAEFLDTSADGTACGYWVFYNDTVVDAVWYIQSVLEMEFEFSRRSVISYSPSPIGLFKPLNVVKFSTTLKQIKDESNDADSTEIVCTK